MIKSAFYKLVGASSDSDELATTKAELRAIRKLLQEEQCKTINMQDELLKLRAVNSKSEHEITACRSQLGLIRGALNVHRGKTEKSGLCWAWTRNQTQYVLFLRALRAAGRLKAAQLVEYRF